jgi:hypothetical protein
MAVVNAFVLLTHTVKSFNIMILLFGVFDIAWVFISQVFNFANFYESSLDFRSENFVHRKFSNLEIFVFNFVK